MNPHRHNRRDTTSMNMADKINHNNRFRRVANRYPRRVAEAYNGDLARAMADDDETVAATVGRGRSSKG
jgi:hypothetical protein